MFKAFRNMVCTKGHWEKQADIFVNISNYSWNGSFDGRAHLKKMHFHVWQHSVCDSFAPDIK